ncbi:MAG: P-loop NTPase, partial [Chloroflexi bacterium]|nr:P-loop NTPase [Chloroflexota bacterium]
GRGKTFAADMGVPYLGSVPFDPRLSRETDAGRPFVLEHADSAAGRAIATIASAL